MTITVMYKHFTVTPACHTLSNFRYEVYILFLVDCSKPQVIFHCKLHAELYNRKHVNLQVQLSNNILRHKTILKNLINFLEKTLAKHQRHSWNLWFYAKYFAISQRPPYKHKMESFAKIVNAKSRNHLNKVKVWN